MQGSTVPADSKVVIHWHPKFAHPNCAGVAYVCLGRSEELKDIYIKGKLDKEGIHASTEALEETNRLQTIFDQNVERLKEKTENFWQISYLNVRNLNWNEEYVRKDNFLLAADIFALGETWLKPGEERQFEGSSGFFANHGGGKGVSVFSRIDGNVLTSITSDKYSCIHLRTCKFDAIFVYLSSGCDKDEVSQLLETWIDQDVPTTIMGDFNIDFSKDDKLVKSLEHIGFEQLINESTIDTGNLIDHIYVNVGLKSLNISTQRDSAFYSDHDVITLHIPK